jgi:excinuclease ABC subunit A
VLVEPAQPPKSLKSRRKSPPIPATRPAAPPRRPRETNYDDTLGTAAFAVDCLQVLGARHHNLKNIDVTIPLGTLTVVTGPSGCGKSSLVNDVLFNALARRLHRSTAVPGAHRKLLGLMHVNKVIRVDQTPLGNSPASNPATYTGVFDLIRELFANLPEARVRGYSSRRFSFNVPGGRCEQCAGNGQKCIEMHFLPNVWVECEACRGRRYNDETLAVKFHGHSIDDVLEMTAGQAAQLFRHVPRVHRIIQTLCDVGLDYVRLGQSAPTLSGGEAQRVKLAAELARPDTGRTLYLLDEPTTGLHFDDLAKLLDVLHRLVDLGNTIVLIEHNLDVIKNADWVIDLGPEAGSTGGQIVATGTPESIAQYAQQALRSAGSLPRSYTGEFLAEVLARDPREDRSPASAHSLAAHEIDRLAEPESAARLPWESDGRRWHTQTRVGRDGKQVQWDGEILARVVDFIQSHGDFAETNWNQRSIVEITGKTKAHGWFLHAITGETWLLKLKFRVRRNTFDRQALSQRIPLKTLNQMDEIPRYGNEPRLRIANLPGGWQEIELRLFSLPEVDTEEFWRFVEQAIQGFQQRAARVNLRLDEHTPWAKLGKKWHFLPKGFPPGRRVAWNMSVLEKLHDQLVEIAPEGQFAWNNKQIVHLFVPQQKAPWASIQTKKHDAVWLHLTGPKNAVAVGEIADQFPESTLDRAADDLDVIRIPLTSEKQLRSRRFTAFLAKHLRHLTG